MKLLSQLIPSNYQEERAAFLADPEHNPQFIYQDETAPETLNSYGAINADLLELAKQIVVEAYYNRNELDLFALRGPELTQVEVEERIVAFLRVHQLDSAVQITWSSSYVSRTAFSPGQLKLKLPVAYRRDELTGMLYHEIGTHALRRVNYEKQPWFKRKKHFGFGEYLGTEEGLATLHGLLPDQLSLAVVSALRYVTCNYAQHHSFVETARFLGPYVQDPERRFNHVFRQKRGLTDTSRAGGFTKDALYFSGLVKVWQWLAKNKFDPSLLYWGKLDCADVPLAQQLNPSFKPQLPIFFTHNVHEYMERVNTIGQTNHFSQVKLS